jgi:hypothetical protein
MSNVPNAKPPPNARPKPPTPRRSGRRRRAKAGDLEALRREMWHAIRKVADLLDAPDAEPADLVRAANALAALGNAYRGVTEAADLVPRLEAIEATMTAQGEL